MAAEVVIKTLLAGGAIGALSTHDLPLTAIAEDSTCDGVLIHRESDNPDDPLDFDYRQAWSVEAVTGAVDTDLNPPLCQGTSRAYEVRTG